MKSNITYDHVVYSGMVREFRTATCDYFTNEMNLEPETEEELDLRIRKVIEQIEALLSESPHCQILVVV